MIPHRLVAAMVRHSPTLRAQYEAVYGPGTWSRGAAAETAAVIGRALREGDPATRNAVARDLAADIGMVSLKGDPIRTHQDLSQVLAALGSDHSTPNQYGPADYAAIAAEHPNRTPEMVRAVVEESGTQAGIIGLKRRFEKEAPKESPLPERKDLTRYDDDARALIGAQLDHYQREDLVEKLKSKWAESDQVTHAPAWRDSEPEDLRASLESAFDTSMRSAVHEELEHALTEADQR
jgi:hypothetical protein